MIEKIINSFLYGDSKTKSYLWSMLLLFVSCVGFSIAAMVSGILPLWIFAAALFALGVMVAQSVSFRDMVQDGNETVQKEKNRRRKREAEQNREGEASSSQKKLDEELMEEPRIREPSNKEEEKELANRPSRLKQYDEKNVKQMMVKYKVRKEHYKVIIDQSEVFQTFECPAYLWKDRRYVKFLLLEEEPRIIRIPLEKIHSIGYKKLVPAHPDQEYTAFLESCMVTKLFSEYLPQYKEANYQGRTVVYKNLYTMVPDICLTNTSAKSILELLPVEFMPRDEVMRSENYSEYYKRAYRNNILWKDGVISTTEYKNRMKELMTSLASDHISKEIYLDLLRQLVANRLITNEYASYYFELKK